MSFASLLEGLAYVRILTSVDATVSFIRYGFQANGEIVWDGTSLSCEDAGADEPCNNGDDVLRQPNPTAIFL